MSEDDQAVIKHTQEADASVGPVPRKEYADNITANQPLGPIELEDVPQECSTTPVTFGTGAKRSARALRYDLMPPIALERLAKIYTTGAEEYGIGNWSKGMDWSDTINHALAHLFKYLGGDYSEDHLAKVAWAMFSMMYFEDTDVGNNDLYRWHWEKKE